MAVVDFLNGPNTKLCKSYESPTHISIIFSLRYEIGQKNVDFRIFESQL